SPGSGGEPIGAQEIAARAAAGDALADRSLARYESRMARALASVINVLDPDVIVLGGGLSNIDRLYERVPRLWAPHVFSDRIATRLVRAAHGDSSGVRGAAWLWEGRTRLNCQRGAIGSGSAERNSPSSRSATASRGSPVA